MDILEKTLNQMPSVFSSNHFSTKAQKNGLSKIQVNAGAISFFLHKNAEQMSTRRMWHKKHFFTSSPIVAKENITDKISDAIKLLKENGYKVMKPINEWIEL